MNVNVGILGRSIAMALILSPGLCNAVLIDSSVQEEQKCWYPSRDNSVLGLNKESPLSEREYLLALATQPWQERQGVIQNEQNPSGDIFVYPNCTKDDDKYVDLVCDDLIELVSPSEMPLFCMPDVDYPHGGGGAPSTMFFSDESPKRLDFGDQYTAFDENAPFYHMQSIVPHQHKHRYQQFSVYYRTKAGNVVDVTKFVNFRIEGENSRFVKAHPTNKGMYITRYETPHDVEPGENFFNLVAEGSFEGKPFSISKRVGLGAVFAMSNAHPNSWPLNILIRTHTHRYITAACQVDPEFGGENLLEVDFMHPYAPIACGRVSPEIHHQNVLVTHPKSSGGWNFATKDWGVVHMQEGSSFAYKYPVTLMPASAIPLGTNIVQRNTSLNGDCTGVLHRTSNLSEGSLLLPGRYNNACQGWFDLPSGKWRGGAYRGYIVAATAKGLTEGQAKSMTHDHEGFDCDF